MLSVSVRNSNIPQISYGAQQPQIVITNTEIPYFPLEGKTLEIME